MAETKVCLQLQQQQNLHFHALDPISLILSHNTSDSDKPQPLKLTTTDSYTMERGPRYDEYAQLRETKLRMKSFKLQQQQRQHESEMKPITPTRKLVKQRTSVGGSRIGGGGVNVVAKSVPDIATVLRKENRKPLPSQELTPPSSQTWAKVKGMLSNSRGSSIAGLRKSYSTVQERKSPSPILSSPANGDHYRPGSRKGGRCGGRVGDGKTFFGYTQS